jgi:hypothetical protein
MSRSRDGDRPFSHRFAACVVLLAWLALAAGSTSLAADPPPTITLLSPASGATLPGAVPAVFDWQISWASPPSEAVTITWQLASDAGFTRNALNSSRPCPASGPACFTSMQARPPAAGTWYWRVAVTSAAGTTYSETRSFTASEVPDADRDGVEDGRDNCPTVSNPDQRDANRNGVGDACEPDRVAPRVKVEAGRLHRGKRATFHFRVSDDRGSVRAAFTLSFRNGVVARGSIPFTEVAPNGRGYFYLRKPVPKQAPSGVYTGCVQVWDRAGNSARSCAAFRLA